MNLYSTTQAAKRLGIAAKSLSRYISQKKVPSPTIMQSGHHVWTEEEVEKLRELLLKIANGRKTRWQRERASAKNKKAKTKKKGS